MDDINLNFSPLLYAPWTCFCSFFHNFVFHIKTPNDEGSERERSSWNDNGLWWTQAGKNGFVVIIYWQGACFFTWKSLSINSFLRWIYIELLIKFSDETTARMGCWKTKRFKEDIQSNFHHFDDFIPGVQGSVSTWTPAFV